MKERVEGRFLSRRMICVVVLILLNGSEGADPKQEHSHGPSRPNFALNGKPMVKIGSSEEKKLAEGEVVMQQVRDKSGGVGAAVEDVAAPPRIVWRQLTTFKEYPKKVPRVKICENYKETKNFDRTLDIYTRFVVGVCPGYSVEYYCHHICNPNRRALVWSLDYDRRSDIDDVHGLWRVTPHPSKKDWSRVEYAVDMRLARGVPGFVVDVLKNKALKDACAWVKSESEKEFAKEASKAATSSTNSPFTKFFKGGASPSDGFFSSLFSKLMPRFSTSKTQSIAEVSEAASFFSDQLHTSTVRPRPSLFPYRRLSPSFKSGLSSL